MSQSQNIYRDARQMMLDLACDVAMYRLGYGRNYLDLIRKASKAATAAADAGVALDNPLFSTVQDVDCPYGEWGTLGWHMRRAHGCRDSAVDPSRFFEMSYANNFIKIRSKGGAGAIGEIEFPERLVGDVFACPRLYLPGSYRQWAEDPYPVGGSLQLLRMDGDGERYGELRFEVGDLHPCNGTIYFGDPLHETEQIAAFCRLEESARALILAARPTDADRSKAAVRAAAIVAIAGSFCFFPRSGYCSTCGGDVTQEVEDLHSAASQTGCPICFRSWCD